MKLYGKNVCLETLKTNPNKVEKVFIRKNIKGNKIEAIIKLCRENKIPFIFYQDKHSENDTQGVYLVKASACIIDDDMLLSDFAELKKGYILVIDSIYDPRNLGAIIRSASAFYCYGIVLPKRNSPPISDVVYKTSSGYVEKIKITRTVNIARFLDQVKELGIQVVGLSVSGNTQLEGFSFDTKVCIVVGSEDKGIRLNVAKRCDSLVRIPMQQGIDSLNISVACSITFYEIFKQLFFK
ncbi:MAG: 23S rRNA (guanosine(2251)-2'-O)-methyltransferase RlmB [Candidatus Hydrogenedentota bacterium]